jgi:hypothetical protein
MHVKLTMHVSPSPAYSVHRDGESRCWTQSDLICRYSALTYPAGSSLLPHRLPGGCLGGGDVRRTIVVVVQKRNDGVVLVLTAMGLGGASISRRHRPHG